MAGKYPINKEFFPFNKFTAPSGKGFVRFAQKAMRVPRFFTHDKELNITIKRIKGYQDEELDLYILSPKDLKTPSPALIFIHGGGFIYEASKSHYVIAKRYAKECRCKVIYVRYNLAPKYPFPYPQYECYNAVSYVYEHADELGIDKAKIGITGDSAGANLSVCSLLLARENGKDYKPLFQLLIYPWLDKRNDSDSNKRYTDTPMWNSSLTTKSRHYTNPHNKEFPPYINSPVEYEDLSFLPPLYCEVAEFDCLHDDGVLFSNILQEKGIPVEIFEVKGTMHGYDTKYNAPTTKAMILKRIAYIKKKFGQ